MEIIAKDPYCHLDKYEKNDPVTLPLTVEEMQRLLIAADEIRVWGINAKLKGLADVAYKAKSRRSRTTEAVCSAEARTALSGEWS